MRFSLSLLFALAMLVACGKAQNNSGGSKWTSDQIQTQVTTCVGTDTTSQYNQYCGCLYNALSNNGVPYSTFISGNNPSVYVQQLVDNGTATDCYTKAYGS